MERPTVMGHPNEMTAKRTDRRFENKFTRRDEPDEVLGDMSVDDDKKFIDETKRELKKARQERSQDRKFRTSRIADQFSMGAERVGSAFDMAADNSASLFLMEPDAPRRSETASKRKIPIYRGSRIVGYKEVRKSLRPDRSPPGFSLDFGADIDAGILAATQPFGRKKTDYAPSLDFGFDIAPSGRAGRGGKRDFQPSLDFGFGDSGGFADMVSLSMSGPARSKRGKKSGRQSRNAFEVRWI